LAARDIDSAAAGGGFRDVKVDEKPDKDGYAEIR
jgi:hypothetical protein